MKNKLIKYSTNPIRFKNVQRCSANSLHFGTNLSNDDTLKIMIIEDINILNTKFIVGVMKIKLVRTNVIKISRQLEKR